MSANGSAIVSILFSGSVHQSSCFIPIPFLVVCRVEGAMLSGIQEPSSGLDTLYFYFGHMDPVTLTTLLTYAMLSILQYISHRNLLPRIFFLYVIYGQLHTDLYSKSTTCKEHQFLHWTSITPNTPIQG